MQMCVCVFYIKCRQTLLWHSFSYPCPYTLHSVLATDVSCQGIVTHWFLILFFNNRRQALFLSNLLFFVDFLSFGKSRNYWKGHCCCQAAQELVWERKHWVLWIRKMYLELAECTNVIFQCAELFAEKEHRCSRCRSTVCWGYLLINY